MTGESAPSPSGAPHIIGRYELYDRIASGGMAAVHLGRLAGPVGFARTVAIKRLHPQFAADPEFVTMFLDEARLAARIQHPNVVPTIDVVATGGELFLVMEYVRGESASLLVRRATDRGERLPTRVVAAIVSGALQGLHAAHEAVDESNKPLGIVHRDVSPHNILVGLDGTTRVLDFGVAKAENRFHSTRGGEIKGKILYMSPEQLEGDTIDRTTDVYAMGLVLFELLTGVRMFSKKDDMTAIAKIVRNEITLPSHVDASLAHWDAVIRAAAGRSPHDRIPTARAMALEVERVEGGVASPVEVADYVERLAGETIKRRTERIAEIESGMRIGREQVQAALATELARPSSGDLPPSSSSLPDLESVRSATLKGSEVSLRAPSPRSKIWVAGAAAAVALAVGVAFAVGRAGSAGPAATTSSVATQAPPTQAPSPTFTATPPPTSQPDLPVASTAAPKTPPAPAAKPAAAANKPNCDRPYTVDSAGHKHFRTECL